MPAKFDTRDESEPQHRLTVHRRGILDVRRRLATTPEGGVLFLPGAELIAADGITQVRTACAYQLEEPIPRLLLAIKPWEWVEERRPRAESLGRTLIIKDALFGTREVWHYQASRAAWITSRDDQWIDRLLSVA